MNAESMNASILNGHDNYQEGADTRSEQAETDANLRHNGEYSHEEDGDLGEDDQDDDLLDDDMMDKLSSSPSIDDGTSHENLVSSQGRSLIYTQRTSTLNSSTLCITSLLP